MSLLAALVADGVSRGTLAAGMRFLPTARTLLCFYPAAVARSAAGTRGVAAPLLLFPSVALCVPIVPSNCVNARAGGVLPVQD